MLGKLIKNAFKATASAVYTNYIAMGVIAVVMLILMFVDWTKWGASGISTGFKIKLAASAILIVTALVCVILTFVSVFGEFRRSMYGNEGQLTLTLPVRSSSLLFAKLFSGSFWVILSYTVFCLCAFGSVVYLLRHSMSVIEGDDTYNLVTEAIRQIAEAAGIATPNMKVILNLAGIHAVIGGIRACVFVLLVFFALTLGNCRPFHKLGKIGPVLYFFAAIFIVHTLATIAAKFVKVYIVVSENAFTFALNEADVQLAWSNGYGAAAITNVYVTALLAVGVFLITALLIDRKVNVTPST